MGTFRKQKPFVSTNSNSSFKATDISVKLIGEGRVALCSGSALLVQHLPQVLAAVPPTGILLWEQFGRPPPAASPESKCRVNVLVQRSQDF